jgi:hypothetical protein
MFIQPFLMHHPNRRILMNHRREREEKSNGVLDLEKQMDMPSPEQIRPISTGECPELPCGAVAL